MVTAIDRILIEIEAKIIGSDRVQRVNKILQKIQNSALQLGLTMLFTGMAIKNFAQSVIRTLGNTFMQLADAQNEGVKRTLELQAATQFLKFILFDTFANSALYGIFVEFVVTAINMISEFIQKHPGLVNVLAVFVAMGVALGAVSMIVGQVLLALVGVFTLISMFAGVSAAVFWPIAIAIGAIAIAAAIFVAFLALALSHLKKHPEHVDLLKKRWDLLVESIQTGWEVLTGFWKTLGVDLPGAGKLAFAVLLAGLDVFIQRITMAVDILQQVIGAWGNLRSGNIGAAAAGIAKAAAASTGFAMSMTVAGLGVSFGSSLKSALGEMDAATLAAATTTGTDATAMSLPMSTETQTQSVMMGTQTGLLAELTSLQKENQNLQVSNNEIMSQNLDVLQSLDSKFDLGIIPSTNS
jgi:MFS family permease